MQCYAESPGPKPHAGGLRSSAAAQIPLRIENPARQVRFRSWYSVFVTIAIGITLIQRESLIVYRAMKPQEAIGSIGGEAVFNCNQSKAEPWMLR